MSNDCGTRFFSICLMLFLLEPLCTLFSQCTTLLMDDPLNVEWNLTICFLLTKFRPENWELKTRWTGSNDLNPRTRLTCSVKTCSVWVCIRWILSTDNPNQQSRMKNRTIRTQRRNRRSTRLRLLPISASTHQRFPILHRRLNLTRQQRARVRYSIDHWKLG